MSVHYSVWSDGPITKKEDMLVTQGTPRLEKLPLKELGQRFDVSLGRMNSLLHSLALQVDPKHVYVYTCERGWRRGREWVVGSQHFTCHGPEPCEL